MKKIVKKTFKAIRLFLKSVGELLCADLIAYLFTQLINNVVFTATPLYRFRYEDLRMEICNLLAWVLFFLVMLIKPLLYHINRECATRHALGQLYLSNTLMTCAAYVAYIALVRLTALKNLIFFGVSCKVYEDRLGGQCFGTPCSRCGFPFRYGGGESAALFPGGKYAAACTQNGKHRPIARKSRFSPLTNGKSGHIINKKSKALKGIRYPVRSLSESRWVVEIGSATDMYSSPLSCSSE